ncbi:MAG: diguanylate cyclase [Chloroflexi bacterium]|nr:diguanylate cyclase [Chloroflexota bacterium]
MPSWSKESVGTFAWAAVPIVGTALVGVFFLLPAGSIEQSAVYDLVGLAAVGAAVVGISLQRPAGWRAWAFMGAGQLAFVVGDVIWTVYQAQGVDPFPSPADISYLLGYPLIAVGLAVAIRRRISGGDRAGLLDAAILATGAAVVWWTLVLGPQVAAADPDPLSFAISLAYPIGDLILIGMALGLLMTPGARSLSFAFLVGSLLILLVADLTFGIQNLDGTYVDGGPLDGTWLIAYIGFGTAALHPSMRGLVDPRPVAVTLLGPVRLVLLAVAMLVGPVLLAVDGHATEAIVVVVAVATALMSVLVLSRLAGMVRVLDRDIERRKVLEEQLSFQAFHDPLTGLANRRRFMEAVTDALATGEGTAALFLDLDDFKDVNDHMGHDAGDAVLSGVGHRLLASIRPADLACRLGGDEFAVLMPATAGIEDAQAVAERLLDALAAPLEVDGVAVRVAASIGVAFRKAGEAMRTDDLLRRSDIAMYHAKARGKHQAASYAPELEATTDAPGSARRTVRGASAA